MGWKLLTSKVTTGNQIPDNDRDRGLSSGSGKTPIDFSGAGLHISVLLKLKQGADWFACFKPRHSHSSLFCYSQVHVPSWLRFLPLGRTHLPSAPGCGGRVRGLAEFQFKVCVGCACGQAPVFISKTQGWPYGSCTALNPSTGTAGKVNCSTTQFFTSAIYILPDTI